MKRLLEQDAKARLELEARLEKQQEEIEKLREEAVEAQVQAAKADAPQPVISDDQLLTLQTRLQGLHAAKLLQDDELFALEDLCADFAELQTVVGTVAKELFLTPGAAFEAAAKLHKLIGVSEKMPGDAAFARQARRKFM